MALENMNQMESVDLTQSFWPILNPMQELELSNSVAQLYLFIYLLTFEAITEILTVFRDRKTEGSQMLGFLLLVTKPHGGGKIEKQRFLCVLCSLSDRYKSKKKGMLRWKL